MSLRNIVFSGLLLLAVSAAAEESIFPKKMEGRWGRDQNTAEMELIKMESPTKAIFNAIFWDICTRRGETTAELKEGTWTFVVPGGFRCADIKVNMTKVTGKNRFEGTSDSVMQGQKFYLEWK